MSVRILQGDCRDVLASLPAESVHCVTTSPPYWGLRDYSIPPTIWGGDPNCAHDFAFDEIATEVGKGNWAQGVNGRGEAQPGGVEAKREPIRSTAKHGFCRCGAWSGALGLEPTYPLYVDHMVEVFRAVKRVLRTDGTLWLNLGDSYATGAGKVGERPGGGAQGDSWAGYKGDRNGHEGKHAYMGDRGIGPMTSPNCMPQAGLKPKDLCGIPWRVAFALQADGWWLRQSIIWSKPNPMPESVTDRCTKSHEDLFLLTKSANYFYDAEGIKEPLQDSPLERGYTAQKMERGGTPKEHSNSDPLVRQGKGWWDKPYVPTSRNKRSVWEIATAPFPEAHFATFPPALIEPCIKAGTSERGCCAKCAAPWERVIERTDEAGDSHKGSRFDKGKTATRDGGDRTQAGERKLSKTLGWYPTCGCDALTPLPPYPPKPKEDLAAWRRNCAVITERRGRLCEIASLIKTLSSTVLDAFGGAGTTGLVADRLQRDAILIELSQAYVAMAQRRLEGDAPLFAAVDS